MCGYFGSEKIICKQVEISYYIMCIKNIVLYFFLPPTLHLCSLLSISNIIVFSTHSPPPKTLFLRLRLRLCLCLSLHSFHILFLFASRARKYLHKLQCLKINPSCRGRTGGGMVGRSVGLIIWNMNLIKSKTKTTSTKMRVSACLCLFICCWFFLSITIAAADRMYILYMYMGIVCMYV